MTPTKSGFPFPLQLVSLDWFCHPRGIFARPAWAAGQALVGNGYLALRVARGYWAASDFDEPSAEFLRRFEGLPWSRFDGIPDEWRAIDDIRGHLYRDAPVSLWTEGGKCAPSRVWRVNGSFLARLSHLQLIARLPRCEIHLGIMSPDAPLLFRFNGGLGMLAADKRLTTAGFTVFEPARHHEDGSRLGQRLGPCVLPRPRPYWADFE